MLLAIYENLSDTGLNNPHNVFTSEDHGVTWTQRSDLINAGGVSQSKMRVLGRGVVLHGDDVGDQNGWYEPAMVARIAVGGSITWASAIVASFVEAGDGWQMQDFAILDSSRVIAVGFGETHGTAFNVLHSTDGGLTFGASTVSLGAFVAYAVAVDAGVVLVGAEEFAQSPRIWRSTDGGASFSPVALPAAAFNGSSYAVYTIVPLGSGVVLAGGYASRAAGAAMTRLWRSTDSGANWTEITSDIASLATVGVCAIRDILHVGSGVVVLALDRHPEYFRLSTDNGLTFPVVGTYSPTPTTGVTIRGVQFALADDGSVIGAMRLDSATSELWRGVISGASVAWTRTLQVTAATATGCGVLPVVNVASSLATVGPPPGCPVLPFAPEPCPQECPTPTTPTLATLPTPLGPQAGFAAPLFWLGLMLGGAPSAMGRPEGCGPFFFPDTQTQECA